MSPGSSVPPPNSTAASKDSAAPVVIEAPAVVELLLGALDAIVAFGVVLANRGLISRQEIADMMARVLDQQSRQPGDNPSRRAAPEVIRDAFSRAVMQGGHGAPGLVAIKGGKDEPSRSNSDSIVGMDDDAK